MSSRVGVVDTLSASYRDAFLSDETVWFVRDWQGWVTAMHFGTARVVIACRLA